MDRSRGRSAAIIGAARTPIGKYGGSLRETPAVQLGALAARAALQRARVDPTDIPDTYMGHCIQAGTGQNPARQVARKAGVGEDSGATTVNMVCGSGMKAAIFATYAIESGVYDLVLAGGMESMSSAPYLVPGRARWGLRYGPATLDDAMQRDSLLDAYGEHEQMGVTGERIARKFHVTRADVDAYGARSHQRAARAMTDGTFEQESTPVPPELTAGGEGLSRDEGPRGETTAESLARLRPSFQSDGVLTAGNSSQLSDGAAALVLASEAEVERRGARPLAWIHSTAVGGVDPSDVMEAPIPTVRRHLARVGITAQQIDRVEHNEAFASASIVVQRTFDFPEDRFNVHGGAIALGHPIGASGARLLVTLAYQLVRSNSSLGLATLCMGGGNGLSVILERRNS
jgi:acetyl-CoA C-acetyltransferase